MLVLPSQRRVRPAADDDFFYILGSSANMYESSGSQFFRTTTRIQSAPDDFEKSRFLVAFLTISGVKNIMQFQISYRMENR